MSFSLKLIFQVCYKSSEINGSFMNVTNFPDMKELAEKQIVGNYRHFMMYALLDILDIAQTAELRLPVQCNFTGVKANLGQGSESVVSILKLNRDTGYYWLLFCLHDMKSTIRN